MTSVRDIVNAERLAKEALEREAELKAKAKAEKEAAEKKAKDDAEAMAKAKIDLVEKNKFFDFLKALLPETSGNFSIGVDLNDWKTLNWSVKLKVPKFIEYVRRFNLAEIISESEDFNTGGKHYSMSYPLVKGLLKGCTISVNSTSDKRHASDQAPYDCLMGGRRDNQGNQTMEGRYKKTVTKLHDYFKYTDSRGDEEFRESSVLISYRSRNRVSYHGYGNWPAEKKAINAPLVEDDLTIFNIIRSHFMLLNKRIESKADSVISSLSSQILSASKRNLPYLSMSSEELLQLSKSHDIGTFDEYGSLHLWLQFSPGERSIFAKKGLKLHHYYNLNISDPHIIYLEY